MEGKSAGELVDYMCYGTYQRYAKGREENFAGLPKSKYGPYSLKINNEYNGGWSGFNQETIHLPRLRLERQMQEGELRTC